MASEEEIDMVVRSLLLPLITLCAVPAAAQQPRTGSSGATEKPSVESYLCTFAGKCDGVAAPTASRDAPRTKGFRLARPATDASAAQSDSVKRAAARSPVQRKARDTESYGNRAYKPAMRPDTSAGATSVVGTSYAALAGTTRAPDIGAASRPRADLMIGFDLNSAQLSSEGVAAAQIFAKSLLTPELKSKRFLIEGHTDLRGGRSINLALSQARAQAVADYLVVLGVQRGRLQTRGYGPDVPLPGHRATDPTNRRVEAELLP